MPFKLPGYDGLNRLRALLAKSFALSRKSNERNLEFHWYAVWNIHLCTLVSAIPNTFVAPQFPLWVDDNDNQDFAIEHEGPEDGDELEENIGDGKALPGRLAGKPTVATTSSVLPQQRNNEPGLVDLENDDELDYGFADSSFVSAASSYHVKNPKTRIPDFAIIWIRGAPTKELPARYTGWEIKKIAIPVIIEIKRYPSRSLKGKDLEEVMEAKMGRAQFELADQADHLFRHYPEAESVIAIAAVGPYWCNKTIRRPTYTGGPGTREITGWSTWLKMYSVHSDRRFQTILKEINKLGSMMGFVGDE